jgi:putative glycosyltransferase (TIGR04348 family)
MKVRLITPMLSNIRNGNQVTALRYAGILRELGHRVSIGQRYQDESCDILIALHALKSSDSIRRFREHNPRSPIVVVLTGTDLYKDLKQNGKAMGSLELASRLVVLQREGVNELPSSYRSKARVIYQSAGCTGGSARPPVTHFKVCVVGHLRPEKDPLRTAKAVRGLPEASRIRVVHVGTALDNKMERHALRESELNPRYRWLGGLPRWKTLRHIASSHLIAITSKIEGSSNVLSESLACSVPVVASRIPGLIGTLGPDYPGYFTAGDTSGLTAVLARAERDLDFYQELKLRCGRLASLVSPEAETSAWRRLLDEVDR